MDSAEKPAIAPPPTRKAAAPRPYIAKWAIVAVVLVVAAVAGWRYWREAELYVSTDNAYVQAHQAEIAVQVGGPVAKLYVQDQQAVKAGDPLFDIDPSNYEIAAAKAQAQLDIARQGVSQESAGVASAEAVLAQRRAEAQNARSNNERTQQLVKSGFLSPQGGEAARTQVETADAAVRAAEANVVQAKSALGKGGEQNAAVQAAAAALKQAELDLQRTHVAAPTSGVVANLSLRPGNNVQPGNPLFVMISDKEYWVDANFKETELTEIRAGQEATIRVDMYPDHPFKGVVESLSGGSGTAFSLLPAQNATGNWVKVTQRVPVRIKVLEPDSQHPLRIGTTASVKVRKAK
ncbi:MAG: efflux RND transporter periplasmic adaptor subunit [Usitatibacter sp.]